MGQARNAAKAARRPALRQRLSLWRHLPRPRRMAKPHRPARTHHIHWNAKMGPHRSALMTVGISGVVDPPDGLWKGEERDRPPQFRRQLCAMARYFCPTALRPAHHPVYLATRLPQGRGEALKAERRCRSPQPEALYCLNLNVSKKRCAIEYFHSLSLRERLGGDDEKACD